MTAHSKPTFIGTRMAPAASVPPVHPILDLPARWVAELPEPLVLRLRVPGSPVPVCVWTGGWALTAPDAVPVLADTIIFDAQELAALVCAVEADRLWHADFLGLCFEKWRNPEVRVQTETLLAGANPDDSQHWRLGRVFQRLGVQLDAVELETAPIARPLHVAA